MRKPINYRWLAAFLLILCLINAWMRIIAVGNLAKTYTFAAAILMGLGSLTFGMCALIQSIRRNKSQGGGSNFLMKILRFLWKPWSITMICFSLAISIAAIPGFTHFKVEPWYLLPLMAASGLFTWSAMRAAISGEQPPNFDGIGRRAKMFWQKLSSWVIGTIEVIALFALAIIGLAALKLSAFGRNANELRYSISDLLWDAPFAALAFLMISLEKIEKAFCWIFRRKYEPFYYPTGICTT